MKIVFRDRPKVYTETSLASFLEISPSDPEGWHKSLVHVNKQSFQRKELSKLLHAYNESIGNDAYALDKIKELEKDTSFCVLTGQQLGLMGGPAYTILKAATCIALANRYRAIPLFWLATEDHDIGEIDHTYLLDPLGNLRKFHLAYPKDGRFVEDLQISPIHLQTIEAFFQAIDRPEDFAALADETSYCRMMIRLLSNLFRGTGLIFVEPYLLRSLAKPFFKREVEEAKSISVLLKETTQRLQDKGGHVQLKISDGTNLFLKAKGKIRAKIQRVEEGLAVGNKMVDAPRLVALLEESPHLFSTNAAARAVLQSVLFPTVAYVAGPGELAYFHQLKEYFRFHGTLMPWVVPRMSATFVTPKASTMLDQCRLKPWEPIPRRWSSLFPELEEGVEEVAQEWLKSAESRFGSAISPQALSTFANTCARRLGRKISSLRLKRRGIPPYALHYLTNLLHPHQTLQERVINWLEFQSQTQENMIMELMNHRQIPSFKHLYCFL